MSDEQSRAVSEVAKTTGEIVKAAGGFGSYLARIFSSIPEDTLGLAVGDWLAHKRRRHLAELEANTTRIIERIAVERLTEPSPSVLIPLLQAAVDEGRPALQAMWSALLANAMIDGGKRVRRDYFEALRQMEPEDALVLNIIAKRPNPHSDEKVAADADMQYIEHQRGIVGLSQDDWAIAVGKLVKLDCVWVRQVIAGMALPVPQPREYPPSLTAFGRGLLTACNAR